MDLSKINGNITHKYLGRNNAATTQLVMGSASLITQISGDRILVINYIHYINRKTKSTISLKFLKNHDGDVTA
jgi:hypothetical protein